MVVFNFIFAGVENIVGNGTSTPGTPLKNETKYPNDGKILAKILQPNETVNSQDSQGFTPLLRAANLGMLSNSKSKEIETN